MKHLGVRSPGRRTEAIPEKAWDPVLWENDIPFRMGIIFLYTKSVIKGGSLCFIKIAKHRLKFVLK